MSLAHLKAGDPVILYREYMREPVRPTKVTKVGRKYLYVEGDRSGYHRDTGQGDDSAYRTWLRTPEQQAHIERVAAARKELWDFGIRLEHSIKDAVVLEIREALLAIVPRTAQPSGPLHTARTTTEKK